MFAKRKISVKDNLTFYFIRLIRLRLKKGKSTNWEDFITSFKWYRLKEKFSISDNQLEECRSIWDSCVLSFMEE